MEKIDICNEALLLVGRQRISSLTDQGSLEASQCNLIFESSVLYLLSQYSWSFARCFVRFSPDESLSGIFKPKYTYFYMFPGDFLALGRVYKVSVDIFGRPLPPSAAIPPPPPLYPPPPPPYPPPPVPPLPPERLVPRFVPLVHPTHFGEKPAYESYTEEIEVPDSFESIRYYGIGTDYNGPIGIEYTSKNYDINKFSHNFLECLKFYIARHLSISFKDSIQNLQYLEGVYRAELAHAKLEDALKSGCDGPTLVMRG